jgi:histidine triad (HIT) family protein
VKFKSNAPKDYVCPICAGLRQPGGPDTLIAETDYIYRDEYVSALINTFFMGKNAGHVIVVPNEHYENIYDLPVRIGHKVFDTAQKVAIAMKQAYGCDGITTRQNNEPAGDQHGFHFHFHIVPRYHDDRYNRLKPRDRWLAESEERAGYAEKLRAVLER